MKRFFTITDLKQNKIVHIDVDTISTIITNSTHAEIYINGSNAPVVAFEHNGEIDKLIKYWKGEQ